MVTPFGGRLEAVTSFFTVVVVRVDVDPVLAEAAGSGWVDALTAIGQAWRAVSARFDVVVGVDGGVGSVTAWQCACAVSAGRLLSPSWPVSGGGW